jgi:hypothetical protein
MTSNWRWFIYRNGDQQKPEWIEELRVFKAHYRDHRAPAELAHIQRIQYLTIRRWVLYGLRLPA